MNVLMYNYWTSKVPMVAIVARGVIIAMSVRTIYTIAIVITVAVVTERVANVSCCMDRRTIIISVMVVYGCKLHCLTT